MGRKKEADSKDLGQIRWTKAWGEGLKRRRLEEYKGMGTLISRRKTVSSIEIHEFLVLCSLCL